MMPTSGSKPETHLAEIVRKARAQKAEKKRRGSEQLERVIDRRAVSTKALLKTDFQGDPSHIEEFAMMSLFHRMNDEYHRRSVPVECTMSKRAVSYWRRVINAQEKAGVDPETYLRAQFAYFHDAFGCAPKAMQLATENAIMRAKEFAVTKFQPKVYSNASEFPIELIDLFKTCEKQLQQIQKAHKLSRVEVYKQFVLTGTVYFPKSFLEHDPAFKQAKNG